MERLRDVLFAFLRTYAEGLNGFEEWVEESSQAVPSSLGQRLVQSPKQENYVTEY